MHRDKNTDRRLLARIIRQVQVVRDRVSANMLRWLWDERIAGTHPAAYLLNALLGRAMRVIRKWV
jgi:hypothetical protein